MKGLIITHPGLQAVAAKDVKDIIDKDSDVRESVAIFETDKFDDLCLLCYKSQSAIKVMQLFMEFEVSTLEDAFEEIKNYDFSAFIKDKTFAVRSRIVKNDIFDSMETEREIGAIIHDRYNKDGVSVNLEKPDITFFVYVYEKSFYFGIDLSGFDLSKRNYRLFCQSDAIKGTLAYCLVRLAGYKPNMVFVDPFSQSGTVCIEAAHLASGKSINYYNKDKLAFLKLPQMEGFDFDAFFEKHDTFNTDVKGINCFDAQHRHINAAEKNSKVTGLNKMINFSRTEVEWLDTKFEKGSVDCIATNPPKPSIHYTSDNLEKSFQEFFYTADFVLKPGGKIVVLGKNYPKLLGLAQRYNFLLKANFEIWQGKETFNILIFTKKD